MAHQDSGLGTLLAFYAVLVCASATSPEPSTCGTNCRDNLCTDGKCKECNDGFFGPSCTELCPLACATCKEPFTYYHGCLSCKAGFYGKNCEFDCPDKCLNSICQKLSGKCSDGCVSNFTGHLCCTKDGPCITCFNHTQCKVCQGNFTGKNCQYCLDGTHGSNCDKPCNENCKSSVCARNNGTCIEGCNGNFAPYECNECNPGYWSSDCTEACPVNCVNTDCVRNTGECIICKSGWYGPSCNEQCSRNCKVGTCNMNTGACDQGCKDGFTGDMCDSCVAGKWGTYCNIPCPDNCLRGVCDRDTEHCTHGCNGTHYADKCDIPCPDNCLRGVCDRDTGHCTYGCNENYSGSKCDKCNAGKHGEDCTLSCPPTCKSSTCERETGNCIGGCIPNFSGDKCCTEYGHCQTCSSHTVCSHCINGYYGDTCSESCSSGCYNDSCDRRTGDCSRGCMPGFYGDKCCLNDGYCSKCSNNKECAECKTYYYGDRCRQRCPQKCDGNKCHRNNGTCSLGCVHGYSGDRCCSTGQCETCSSDTVCAVCKVGFYRKWCDKRCSIGCISNTCHKDNATCVLGCKAGYYGPNCDKDCSPNCIAKKCHRENGHCAYGCQDGFTGDKCCLKDGHCDRCSSKFECGQCSPGYHGYTCSSECSDGCKDSACARYNGTCSNGCLAGLTGDKCCQKDGFCKTCKTNTECSECTDWYFGQNCDQGCSVGCKDSRCKKTDGTCRNRLCKSGYSGDKCCVQNSNCEVCSSTSDCSECKNDFYGKDCEHQCPAHCSDNICLKTNGFCSKGCDKGFFGTHCKQQCPDNCKNNKCNQTNGICSKGCKKGYHGKNCDKSCPGNCRERKCRQDYGTCYKCVDAFYGDNCTKLCSKHCSHGNCNKSDGTCSPCTKGYHGLTCREKCHENCISCSSNTDCGSRCKNGYHGRGCRSTCPRNCTACTSDTQCTECKPGYRGAACQEECSSCKPGTECRQTDGYCYEACKDGYTSQNCNRKCYAHCATCPRDYRYFSYCTKCAMGRYGKWRIGSRAISGIEYSQCNEKCSVDCSNERCDERTGKCVDCPGSLHGAFCNCPAPCDQCHDDGSCISCKDMFANPRSACICRKDTCLDKNVGNTCQSCVNATWYPYTDSSACCPCRNTCKDSQCDAENSCTGGCELGYYGNGCKGKCDDKQRRCVSCELDRGGEFSCKECQTGYYPHGINCERCSDTCVNGTCDPASGRCIYSCKEGYWKEKCDERCGSNCISGTCDPSSGQCTHGCIDGFWGDKCGERCGQNCEKCTREGICLICEAGRYQEDCFGYCSHGCKMTKEELRCNMSDGSCPLGCNSRTLHGKECDLACSDNCTDSECDWLTGKCSKGCQINMFSDFCNQTCSDTCESIGDLSVCFDTNGTCIDGCVNGYYDDRCEESCHTNCINGTCDRTTGECVHGCVSGFAGADCSQALSSPAPADISGVAAVIAATLVCLLVLLGIVIVVRHRRKQRPEVGKVDVHVPSDSIENVPLDNYNHVVDGEDAVYANVQANAGIPTRTLVDYVNGMTEDTYSEQYEKLPRGLTKPHDDALKPASVPRNRYKSIYPYDHCRVKLIDGDNDYINASYIDGYNRGREYIASLGPLKRTTEQFAIFWQMIWQDRVEKIVMVTNLDEPTGMKCQKYWPDPDTNTEYGDVTVLCRIETVYANYVIRSMQLTKAGETRTLHHFHYTAWPDKSAPADTTSLIDFRHKVSNLPLRFNGPTVVHCSAGVGRTGTYIALDHLCMQADVDQRVDIFECVLNMREQRLTMVQTQNQYIFLHRALAVYVTLGCQPIKSACFSEYTENLNASRLKTIFKNLEVCRSLAEQETTAIDRNREFVEKNRKDADIPGDKYRVRLHLERTFGSSDYINAVYFNGYSQSNRYIVAQTPLKGDEDDFVTLLLQEKCAAIVDLNPVTSRDDNGLAYLTANSPGSKVRQFKVTCRESASCTKFKQHTVTITVGDQSTIRPKEMTIPLYQFRDWASDVKVPESPEDFVEFIRGVEAIARKSQENGPVLLHCGTAGGRSCLFYVVAMAIKNLETEHEISVVSTVHQARTRRPIAIPNKEQLAFCFHCLNAYLQTNETYTNFVM